MNIDFKILTLVFISKEWSGAKTWSPSLCLHHVEEGRMNPYQQVISIVARTLEAFDEDKLIPVFGFGDLQTKGFGVFPFYTNKVCYGLDEVLHRYNEITPQVILSGPTNFAPLIRESIKIVKETKDYHILIIITDGDVNSEQDTGEFNFFTLHSYLNTPHKRMQLLKRATTLSPLCVLALETGHSLLWYFLLGIFFIEYSMSKI